MDVLLSVVVNNPNMVDMVPPNLKKDHYDWWIEAINFANQKRLTYTPMNPLSQSKHIMLFETVEEMDRFISLYYNPSDPAILKDLNLWYKANDITIESIMYTKVDDPSILGLDMSKYTDLYRKTS